jgi:hypothetical protein
MECCFIALPDYFGGDFFALHFDFVQALKEEFLAAELALQALR